jgi:hypothetical protein
MRRAAVILAIALVAWSCTTTNEVSPSPTARPSAERSAGPPASATATTPPSPFVAPARAAAPGFGDDAVVGLPDAGPYAPNSDSVAFVRGHEIVVKSPFGSRSLYDAGNSIPFLLVRPDGWNNGRLAFVEYRDGGKARVLTLGAQDTSPTVLDIVDFAPAGGGPWPEEPRPMTDGVEVLWQRHLAGPPETFSLMRSRDGGPGVELYRSAQPFLFTTNVQHDIVLATTPRSPDVRAQLVLLEKTGRIRIIADRPSAEAGVPLAVADQIGWSQGLLERSAALAGSDRGPTTVVDLWQLFTGEHTRVDLGCTLNAATERHLVARCADRFIVRDLEQGLVGELPLLKPIAVVSKTAILRQAEQFLLTPVSPLVDRYPEPPPTVLWSVNTPPGQDRATISVYFAGRGPFRAGNVRLLDPAGSPLGAPGIVIGHVDPDSCTPRIDGSLGAMVTISAAQLADVMARAASYRWQVQVEGTWRPLMAIDSGCRTTLTQ